MTCPHPGWRTHRGWLACTECGEPMKRYASVAALLAATRARLRGEPEPDNEGGPDNAAAHDD